MIFTFHTISDRIITVKKLQSPSEVPDKINILYKEVPMNNTRPIFNTTDDSNFKDTIFSDVQKILSDTILSTEKESKDKYETKAKLIEKATDMSTQEKLTALDKNYACRNLEAWQNILYFAAISVGALGLFIGNPVTTKNVRKLLVS